MKKTDKQIEIEMGKIKTKEQVQVEQQFLYTFSQIIEAFPQYTISQHLCHFSRKREETKESYHWSDEKVLRKIEEYYDELTDELASTLND